MNSTDLKGKVLTASAVWVAAFATAIGCGATDDQQSAPNNSQTDASAEEHRDASMNDPLPEHSDSGADTIETLDGGIDVLDAYVPNPSGSSPENTRDSSISSSDNSSGRGGPTTTFEQHPDAGATFAPGAASDAATTNIEQSAPESSDATSASATTSDTSSSETPEPANFMIGETLLFEGTTCGLAFDSARQLAFVYPCNGDEIFGIDSDGTVVITLDAPGEPADDVDLDIAATALTLNETTVPQGSLLFANGDTGVAELYAVDIETDSVLTSLVTNFGQDHVVGMGHHPSRGSVFMLQDESGGTQGNTVAEVSPVDGQVLGTFSSLPNYYIAYGDVDICASTSNVLLVSSNYASIGEFTPTGSFVQSHPLPEGVGQLSGISVDDGTGQIWVVGTTGQITRLDSDLCPVSE